MSLLLRRRGCTRTAAAATAAAAGTRSAARSAAPPAASAVAHLPIPVMAASPAVVAEAVLNQMFAVTFVPPVSVLTVLPPD